MPIYVFKCEECDNKLEVEQSIKKPTPNRKRCPTCKKNSLSRVLFSPHVYNKPGDDNITVGLLSDRNTGRLSSDQKESIEIKHRTGPKKEKKKEKNFWKTSKDNLKNISDMTPEKKKKYIETGEK